MRAAIYARVSTEKQERDQTIDSQLSALRAWVVQQGHDLSPGHIFSDPGRSGARLDRPGLDKLRDAAAAWELDVIAVYSPDLDPGSHAAGRDQSPSHSGVSIVAINAAMPSMFAARQPRPGTFSRRPIRRASPSTARLPIDRPERSRPK